jgi:hypothetical protein
MLLPFETIVIMASWFFFPLYECQGIKNKNSFDPILSFFYF